MLDAALGTETANEEPTAGRPLRSDGLVALLAAEIEFRMRDRGPQRVLLVPSLSLGRAWATNNTQP